jgi:DNA-binding CsgD family transcriptional regulator
VSTAGLDAAPRLLRLLHRELDLDSFFDEVDQAVRDLVPFDSSCWLSLDPSTLLPTSHFTRQLDSDHLMEIAENEFLEDDFNKFAVLARGIPPVSTLSHATRGDPTRSRRHRKVLAPHGYADGDEMRVVFLDAGSAWGCVALHRREGVFTAEEAGILADVAQPIGEAIHRALLLGALKLGHGDDLPGLILIAGDGTVDNVSPSAQRLLAEMLDSTAPSNGLSLVMTSLVADLRSARTGHAEEPRSVRVPSRSGQWYHVCAALLDDRPDGRVSVIVHQLKEPGIPLPIVDTHGLTAREREVTGLVLRGCSTHEIASSLHLSPYTVQDHLKAVFTKLRVRSRRELVAKVFAQHYAPRLELGNRIGPDGWFAD